MLYNERVISDTTPSVGIYEGNQGQAYFMKEGERLKDEAAKEMKQAEQIEEKAHKLNLAQGMNALANNDQLMNNPQALGTELDKLAKGVAANIKNEEMRLNILTDYELDKMSYLNKATANMKRIQNENARSATYDSIYKDIDKLGLSFSNGINGSPDQGDVVNFQYSLNNIRKNINARNLDGTYMFTDAQRREMARNADKFLVDSFVNEYSKMPEAKRMAIASKLENDYFRISIPQKDGFKYKGNIDLDSRPVYRNKDGSVSTEVSTILEMGGKYVVLPTIRTEGGKRIDMTPQQAGDWYEATGQHLGIYDKLSDAEKASEKIHERGENGIDVRDIVGEDAYQDIKRGIGNYNALIASEQLKAREQEKKYRVAMFPLNPSGIELESIKRDYPDISKSTLDNLESTWRNSPNYSAETTNWKEAQHAIMTFADTDYKDDETRMKDYLRAVSDIQRANATGVINYKDMESRLDDLSKIMIDKEVLDVYRAIKPYYNSVLSTMEKLSGEIIAKTYGYEGKIPETASSIAGAWKKKRITKQAEDYFTHNAKRAFDGLKDYRNPKAVENFIVSMKELRENIIGYIDPNLAGLKEGQVFSINGIPHKYMGVSNNGDVLVEEVK